MFRLPLSGGPDRVIYDFADEPDTNGGNSSLVQVGKAVYGTSCGSPPGFAYKVSLGASAHQILHVFGASNDGYCPAGGLIYAGGLLYGVTTGGGALGRNGTIFSLDPATGAESVVYNFSGGADGSTPVGGMVALAGALYGTTSQGGAARQGTVFRFEPARGTLTTLHAFTGDTDGAYPQSKLTVWSKMIFGTTNFGSTYNQGTVFRIVP